MCLDTRHANVVFSSRLCNGPTNWRHRCRPKNSISARLARQPEGHVKRLMTCKMKHHIMLCFIPTYSTYISLATDTQREVCGRPTNMVNFGTCLAGGLPFSFQCRRTLLQSFQKD